MSKKSGLQDQVLIYFKSHPRVNALAHLSVGMGLGILLTHPYIDPHPLRWAVVFLIVGFGIHLYPMLKK